MLIVQCSTNQPFQSALVVQGLLYIILIDTLTQLLIVCFQENIVKVFNHYYAFRKKIKTSFTVLRQNPMTGLEVKHLCMTTFLSRFVETRVL